MYALATGLVLTGLTLGVLVGLTMRLSLAVFEHPPGWGILLVHLSR
jgi:hypothetical protein